MILSKAFKKLGCDSTSYRYRKGFGYTVEGFLKGQIVFRASKPSDDVFYTVWRIDGDYSVEIAKLRGHEAQKLLKTQRRLDQ